MYQQVDTNGQYEKDFPPPQGFVDNNNNDRRFRYAESEYRDKPWMIAFYIHIIAMLAVAAMFGKSLMKAIRENSSSSTWKISDLKSGMLVIIVAAFTGIGFGFFWMKMMKK